MKKKYMQMTAMSVVTLAAIASQAQAQVTISSESASGNIDLTAIGTLDWMKLGDGTNTGVVNQKLGADHIGTVIGGPTGFVSGDFGATYLSSWTDGDAAGATGTNVGGNLEAKSPGSDDSLLPSLSFDITGLAAGSYELQVYTTWYRSNTSFTATLGGGASDNISSTVRDGDAVFTVAFTALENENLSIVWAQTQDRVANVDDNVGISAITLTAVPEPGAYALLAGSLALGAVMVRRRRA